MLRLRRSSPRLQWMASIAWLSVAGCGDAEPARTPGAGTAGARVGREVALVALDASALEPGVAAAVEAALGVARAAPEDAGARLELGMVCDANSLFEPAEASYAQAAVLAPENARAWYHLARMREELADLDGARAALERALELAPDYAPAARRSAAWHAQAGELDAATEQYEKVRELEPDWPDGGLGLARVALLREQPARAEALAREVLAEHGDSAYGWHLLGTALRDLGRADEALEAFARAAGGAPVWRDPWVDEVEALVQGTSLSMVEAKALLAAGRFEEAATRLAKMHAEAPDDVTVQGMRTAALTNLGRYDEALQMLMAAKERQPEHFRIELNLAIVRWRRGDLDLALAHVQRSIELHPEHSAARLVHGQILGERGDAAGAVEAYLAALRTGAEPRRVLPRLGRWQVALERWSDAAETYTRAARELPDDASIHAYLGGSLAESGDTAGARKALERARALAPGHALLRSIEARLAALDAKEEP